LTHSGTLGYFVTQNLPKPLDPRRWGSLQHSADLWLDLSAAPEKEKGREGRIDMAGFKR